MTTTTACANSALPPSDRLKHLILILTYRCQLRCKMCGQVNAPAEAPNSQLNKELLPWDLLKERLDELKSLRTTYLFGGEPLLHKDIFPILHYMRDRGIATSFSTNGLLLGKYARQIVEAQPVQLSVSLDSHVGAEHDDIRGFPGLFDRTLTAMDEFLTVRREMGLKKPELKIHFTICPSNYTTMKEYYDFFDKRFPEVDTIKFHAPRFATPKMIDDYDRIMADVFEARGLSCSGNFSRDDFNEEYSRIDVDRLADDLAELLTRPKTSITGPVDREELREFFFQPEKMPQGRRCACFKSVAIQPNGDVVMCADYPDYSMGNIRDSSLDEIWSGERALNWRSYLNTHGNPGVLVKCSRLYPSIDFKKPGA